MLQVRAEEQQLVDYQPGSLYHQLKQLYPLGHLLTGQIVSQGLCTTS